MTYDEWQIVYRQALHLGRALDGDSQLLERTAAERAGVGANLSVALTKRITLAVGYGDGTEAPRGRGFGGHEVDTQFEFKS